MKILNKISQCRNNVKELKKKGQKIGLVPTMGYLHEGHLSLVKAARQQCQKVFLTIFVNPTQFGPTEDFNRYPRDLKRDFVLAEENRVDYIFSPEAKEVYKKGHTTYVEAGNITKKMCGTYRPGHFKGVVTTVLKLFNIIPAHKAYFGRKDYQQLVAIKKMVEDLDLDIEIIDCPTVRGKDGLALSSRNKLLEPKQRENAVVLYEQLKQAEKAILSGERVPRKIKDVAVKALKDNPFIQKIDYFDIRDAKDLKKLNDIKRGKDILIATAVWVGGTRLIDNIVICK